LWRRLEAILVGPVANSLKSVDRRHLDPLDRGRIEDRALRLLRLGLGVGFSLVQPNLLGLLRPIMEVSRLGVHSTTITPGYVIRLPAKKKLSRP